MNCHGPNFGCCREILDAGRVELRPSAHPSRRRRRWSSQICRWGLILLLLGVAAGAPAQDDAPPQDTPPSPTDTTPEGAAPPPVDAMSQIATAQPVAAPPPPPAPIPEPKMAVLPIFNGGETEGFFYVDLDNGQIFLVDRLRRDPLAGRRQRLSENLFRVIGRPTDQPAYPGEILLAPILNNVSTVRDALFVETSSGYTAYFSEPGRDDSLGQVSNLLGRPFSPLSSMDGRSVLLMRRVGSGKTEGAYLYHAATGRALYIDKIDKLAIEVSAQATEALPILTGPPTAVEIQGSSQDTRAYLLIDGGNGELHSANLISGAPTRFSTIKSSVNLLQGLGSAVAGPRRFVAAAIQDRGEATKQIFFLDPLTGDMALLDSLDNNPRLEKLAPNLFAGTGRAPSSSSFVAIPRNLNSGATQGIWLLDTSSSRLFYVDNAGSPNTVTVREVRLSS